MNLSRVAAKQLTPSDLSFFTQHLRRSKQKGINLNSDVFVDVFYPSLKNRFEEIHFPLTVIGPRAASPHILSRKAIRSPGGKNWRLDGEMISDPLDESGRYDSLQDGDIGVMAFEGSLRPEAVTLILVTQTQDGVLHAAISEVARFQARQSMVVLSQEELASILAASLEAYPDNHPLQAILSPDSIEEAVFGSAESQQRTSQTDGRGAAVSQEALRRQLQASDETGQLGEEAFGRWLTANGHDEDAGDFEWVSRSHARAAFDYHVVRPQWPGPDEDVYIDVKATKGLRETPIHMSMAELRWAAQHDNYRIGRIYDLGTGSPKLSLLKGVHELARQIVQALGEALPSGVSVDGLQLEISGFEEECAGHIDATEE